ncbi:MAG: hypothetical protein HUU15_05180 [Candidatus Brocadiae bacterium]|nr:hypothetical protein [Candidatus Brocadiia bacterium]
MNVLRLVLVSSIVVAGVLAVSGCKKKTTGAGTIGVDAGKKGFKGGFRIDKDKANAGVTIQTIHMVITATDGNGQPCQVQYDDSDPVFNDEGTGAAFRDPVPYTIVGPCQPPVTVSGKVVVTLSDGTTEESEADEVVIEE